MSLFTHRVIRMVYLFENNTAVSITYSFPTDRLEVGKQLAAYSLDSFQESLSHKSGLALRMVQVYV